MGYRGKRRVARPETLIEAFYSLVEEGKMGFDHCVLSGAVSTSKVIGAGTVNHIEFRWAPRQLTALEWLSELPHLPDIHEGDDKIGRGT
jgi:hypothetical protein